MSLKTSKIEKEKKSRGFTIGALKGLGKGLVIGGSVVGFGFLISLTVIGAIIGIPLIVIGFAIIILGPFVGGLVGLATRKAKCPYCQNEIKFNVEKALTCENCHKRLLVRDNPLSLVE